MKFLSISSIRRFLGLVVWPAIWFVIWAALPPADPILWRLPQDEILIGFLGNDRVVCQKNLQIAEDLDAIGVYVRNAWTGDLENEISFPDVRVHQCYLRPRHPSHLFLSLSSGEACLLEYETRREIYRTRLTGHMEDFSADGKWFAAWRPQKEEEKITVEWFDASTGKCQHRKTDLDSNGSIRHVGDRIVYVAGIGNAFVGFQNVERNSIHVWDASSGDLLWHRTGNQWGVEVSPCGDKVISGTECWSLSQNRCIWKSDSDDLTTYFSLDGSTLFAIEPREFDLLLAAVPLDENKSGQRTVHLRSRKDVSRMFGGSGPPPGTPVLPPIFQQTFFVLELNDFRFSSFSWAFPFLEWLGLNPNDVRFSNAVIDRGTGNVLGIFPGDEKLLDLSDDRKLAFFEEGLSAPFPRSSYLARFPAESRLPLVYATLGAISVPGIMLARAIHRRKNRK